MMRLKVTQHNTNRQDVAHHSVLQQALEGQIDVVLLQEPYFPGNQNSGFFTIGHPAFYTVLPHPTLQDCKIRPRVMAYIRKNSGLEFTPKYDLCNDPDLQIIEVYGLETFYIF